MAKSEKQPQAVAAALSGGVSVSPTKRCGVPDRPRPQLACGCACPGVAICPAPKDCQWKVDGAVITANHLLFKGYLVCSFYLLEENKGR